MHRCFLFSFGHERCQPTSAMRLPLCADIRVISTRQLLRPIWFLSDESFYPSACWHLSRLGLKEIDIVNCSSGFLFLCPPWKSILFDRIWRSRTALTAVGEIDVDMQGSIFTFHTINGQICIRESSERSINQNSLRRWRDPLKSSYAWPVRRKRCSQQSAPTKNNFHRTLWLDRLPTMLLASSSATRLHWLLARSDE